MAYTRYTQQTVFERKGNLDLLSDNSQRIYTQLNGKDVFFKFVDGIEFTKVLYKNVPWDFHSAEKEGDYIKLIAKNRWTIERHRQHISEMTPDASIFEVYTFDLKGTFIAAELPPSEKNGFDISIPKDASRLAELGVSSAYTELEIWGIQNEHLITEEEISIRGDIRLEEWAYYKYKELYPSKPMLQGLGVKNTKRTDPVDITKSHKQNLYAPTNFNKKSAEKITNFNPSTDTLEIDTDSFALVSSATFAAGKNKRKVKKLAKKDFDFLYDQKKGGLYFNENGPAKGFGEGGIIAILKGTPDLTAENLEFIGSTMYAPKQFNKKYADNITNFNPSTDTIKIDSDSFSIDNSATFAAGKNSKTIKKLAKTDFDFLYDQKKGGLYFNENGPAKGFGDGGIIAILKGAPDLTRINIDFI